MLRTHVPLTRQMLRKLIASVFHSKRIVTRDAIAIPGRLSFFLMG